MLVLFVFLVTLCILGSFVFHGLLVLEHSLSLARLVLCILSFT
jgi:hypothetical protein